MTKSNSLELIETQSPPTVLFALELYARSHGFFRNFYRRGAQRATVQVIGVKRVFKGSAAL